MQLFAIVTLWTKDNSFQNFSPKTQNRKQQQPLVISKRRAYRLQLVAEVETIKSEGISTRMNLGAWLLEVIRIAFQVVEFLLLIGITLYDPVTERERERETAASLSQGKREGEKKAQL